MEKKSHLWKSIINVLYEIDSNRKENLWKNEHYKRRRAYFFFALDVAASHAWRKMEEIFEKICFHRTALPGTLSWIFYQQLITQMNLDSHLQLFMAANKKQGEVLRKHPLLLHWSGNKPMSVDQLPFTDHQRNSFPLGTELYASFLEAGVLLQFNSTSRNLSWDIWETRQISAMPFMKLFPGNVTRWTIWFLGPWILQIIEYLRLEETHEYYQIQLPAPCRMT